MRPYQLQGLNWLVALHHNSLNGILADEMVSSCSVTSQLQGLYLNGVGSWQNPTNYIFPSLSQTPTVTSQPAPGCRTKIHVAELGT